VGTDTGAADGITSDNTQTVDGTGVPGATIDIYVDGAKVGSATVQPNGTWTFTTGVLPEGPHTIVAVQSVAGVPSTPTSPVNVIIDTTGPETPLITSVGTDTGKQGDRLTADNTLTVTGIAEPGSFVTLFVDGNPVGTGIAGPDGSFVITTPALVDGPHDLKVNTTDAALNTSPFTPSVIWTVDTTAPAAPAITAIGTDTGVLGDGLTSDTTLTLTGTAEPGSLVSVYEGATLIGTVVAGPNGAWSLTTTPLADGLHTYTATATDDAGNTSSPSNSMGMTVDTAPPSVPAITSVGPDTGAVDGVTSINVITVTGTADPGSTVKVYENGRFIGTVVADATTGAWSIVTPALADGLHSFTATATDASGNQSAATPPAAITIDTAAPAAPVITSYGDDTGKRGDGITEDRDLTVAGRAEPGSTVTVFADGALVGTVVADANGNWTLPATGILSLGRHVLTAKAADASGNTSAASGNRAVFMVPEFAGAPATQTVTFRVGTQGTRMLPTVNGAGALSWAVASGVLPAGLRLDPRTGAISGIARRVENVVVTVRAADANGHTTDILVNILDVAAFQPYLVSGGNGAITNLGILPQALINPTTYATGTAVAMYDGVESRPRAQYVPFIGYRGEVRVALDDVNRDGRVDILAVPGAGASPVIKMLNVQTGATVRTFTPFAASYTGGVFLTTGDVNNDGFRDIIASTGGGTQPRVVAFDGVSGARLLDFTPFSRGFNAGVTVAVTDTDRNGINEIIVGSGVGDRALVRVFNSVGLSLLREFAPFGRESRVGVNVAAGDIGGDGMNEIVASTMSAESRVTVWDAQTFRMKDNFFAYGQNDGVTPFLGGVRVAIEDHNRDGRGDLITGSGVGGFPHVRVWSVIRGKFKDIASYIATDVSDRGGLNIG
jgi:hypothetical protein